MAGLQRFRYIDAAFIIGSIVTFILDQATDIILAVTFWLEGQVTFSIVTIVLLLLPNIIVQIFSARWNKIDETFNGSTKILHGCLLGTLHRYYMVLKTGLEARSSDDLLDYQRYYQQWSDICMLRLFDSFMESGPQLVFQLYVLTTQNDLTAINLNTFNLNLTWTGVSAVASTVSLGWGVAAYSQALRLVREDKGKLNWMGMVLQTLWRFFTLSARIVALVLLSLALDQWALIVIFVHWLLMMAWVVWQKTDFCSNIWEERLYNAVVAIIYCFCFFNLKEGRSRYRMTIFYSLTFIENLTFVGAYYWSAHHVSEDPVSMFSLVCMVIVVGGTAVGLSSMVLYYRFFHPAGPILPCGRQEEEEETGGKEVSLEQGGDDFVIKNATYIEEKETVPEPAVPKKGGTNLKPSRSFKQQTLRKAPAPLPPSPPPRGRVNTARLATPVSAPLDLSHSPPSPPTEDCKASDKMDSAYGTDSNRTASRNTESSATMFGQAGKSPTEPAQNISGSSFNPDLSGSNKSASSPAFNNETYMSLEGSPSPPAEEKSYMSVTSPVTPQSANNTYQSVHPMSESGKSEHNTSQESQCSRVTVIDQSVQTPKRPRQDLLKRSPVLKDVTDFTLTSSTPAGVKTVEPPPSQTKSDAERERLHAPLTIIIPNISNQAFTKSNSQSPDKWSDKTISLDILNPGTGPTDISNLTSHDYENLALVNINRAPLGPLHWRTYSDMANSHHDDSTKYEKNKLNFTSSSEYSNYSNLAFCDIYPLSRAMREQLYRSLTPVSTAATVATSPDVSDINSDLNSNHTYEPIETASQAFSVSGEYSNIPVTLIHHDGHRLTANKITSLDCLRDTLISHEQIPYDDPENRGDLYILAPMRLLTPIIEESDSELARSKIYQELSTVSRNTVCNYSDVDNSIMSIISEVLSVRGPPANQSKIYANHSELRHLSRTENVVDTNSLLSTIEEIRNNSMCNLYNTSFNDPHSNVAESSLAPRVPPRNTAGYQSLCMENSKSKERNEQQDLVDSFRAKQDQRTLVLPEEGAADPNDSIRSINSNTLVLTPKTVIANKKKTTPLQSTRGCRKNILEIVNNTKDILNTPKRLKCEPMAVVKDNSVLSESVASENNEFKALMPHLTYTGAKFLKKVTKTTPVDEAETDLDGSIIKQQKSAGAISASVRERLSFTSPASSHSSNLSTFSNTPSPVSFVRNIGNQKRPRKLSIVRERKEENIPDDNSDYKYGFVKEHPDAKYGFGYFPTESYNVLETAKLSNVQARQLRSRAAAINPVLEDLQESINNLSRLRCGPVDPTNSQYSLSALNKADTAFKLHPDETYENIQRNNWVTASLQRKPLKNAFSDRDTLTRRSMSILDDLNDEKENIIPRKTRGKSNRNPLGSNSSTITIASPMKNFQPVPAQTSQFAGRKTSAS